MAPAEPNAKPFEVQGELPVFAEERKGWKGYVEWERYPEKKKQAAEVLARYDFPVVSKNIPVQWRTAKEIDPEEYFFEVEGLVNKPMKLTLKDLQDESRFPRMSTAVTLQCSGTRRIEQIHDYPGDGDELINAPWGEGAIGTARYVGVSLKKVIKYCGGLKEEGKNIEFFGADSYFKKGQIYNYAVSVPTHKMKVNEVMLAWEMNGEPLPAIHGAPLRVVVMGYIGARSCKWLTRINVIRDPSMAPVQMKEYIYYTPQIGKHNATYSNGFSIQTMPVASAIMTPVDKDVIIHDGKIKMTGWAYSGSGWPERVEVSNDGGGVWYEVPYDQLSKKYFHAWRTWEIDIPVDAEGWLVNRSKPQTAKRLKMYEDHGTDFLPLTRPAPFDLETEEEYLEEMKKREGRDPVE
ncbi:hypothetical protein SNOG_13212 [Parastagonospora nodorum SN15]|uniref:Oxidoreductase molybdopterin-binding domain-containing protein n=1 Tax=Phaeosphaeria nodorum (strain SN15 / ATCC MYA-4574 / FGSC 10173) TaxID=321614 RepID=Q0U4V2_PHANO|nr:hypothetical protein SNOG_13212 [Parastagonospora nodorum SN15]EAT79539.2 hypothetical protein SNOG_13212 [Parastagonospora nodorum SN15]